MKPAKHSHRLSAVFSHRRHWNPGCAKNSKCQMQNRAHRKKPAAPVPWGGGQVIQPENWRITLLAPNHSVTAEYWKGDADTHIERKEANAWATLANFHKGSGMSNVWILLTDTLAGGLLVLAITGTLLWSRLHGPRLMAAGLIGTTLTTASILMLTTLSLA